MKLFSLLTFLLFSIFALAQKGDRVNAPISTYDESFATLHYLDHNLGAQYDAATLEEKIKYELGLDGHFTFELRTVKKSKTATHFTFQQFYDGIEIYGAQAKVAVSRNNVLFRIVSTAALQAPSSTMLPVNFPVEEKLAQYNDLKIISAAPVYAFGDEGLFPAFKATYEFDRNYTNTTVWWANGEEYFTNDLLVYAVDSTVSVKVFDPDPISPISKIYGGVYVDDSNQNLAVLNPLRVDRKVIVEFDGGVFYLKNEFVEIKEFDSPTKTVETSTTPEFYFSRSHSGFEQVNALYHITKFQQYLTILGYDEVNFPIEVDANGFGGADNSAYNPSQKNLRFGEGGVDDAEDADVIVHEFVHALSDDLSPNTNSGKERNTLDEALGDYFAVSYKKTFIPFGSDKVFNWDGHNPFWDGRTMNNPENFNYKTANFAASNIYKYTTLWNDAVMDIWGQIGKEKTDALVLEMMYGLASNMTFRQAALMMIDADTALFSGANGIIIWKAFDARGILDWSSLEEFSSNELPYKMGKNILTSADFLTLFVMDSQAELTIVNASGQKVKVQKLEGGNNAIDVSALPSGVYFAQINIGQMQFTEKFVMMQ